MRFELMAILGLSLALGGPANAARNDQTAVRAHAAPARAATTAVRPVSSLSARPSTSHAARPSASASSSRGAATSSRGAATSSRGAATSTRAASARGTGHATYGAAHASRGSAQAHQSASRGAVPYHNTAYSSAQQRDRSGRLISQPDYQRAVLRGQSARYAAACTMQRGRRVCGGTRQVAMRWSGGLAPAAGNQSSCPDGTMATLAVGHENVVRCLPL